MIFNEMQDGGLNQLLVRRYGLKSGAPAPSIAPEVFPVLNVQEDDPDLQYLKGVRLAAGRVIVPAAVGQNGAMYLLNPANSEQICTLRQVKIRANSATDIDFLVYGRTFQNGIGGALGNQTAPLDLRNGVNVNGGVNSSCSVSGETLTVLPATRSIAWREYSVDTNDRTVVLPFVLPPNSKLVIYATTANVQIQCSMQWSERRAQPGELA